MALCIVEFSKVCIVRFTQLVDWLYQKGRLSEKQWQQKKNIARDEIPTHEKKDLEVRLEESYKIQVEEITLELMEQNGLVQIMIDIGFQIFVERCTANSIRNHINNLNFGIKVKDWHKELESLVKNDDSFIGTIPTFSQDEGKYVQNLYDDALISTIKIAVEKKLPILTDDRFIQMVQIQHNLGSQFGTDALLNDLYKKEIINLEEFANGFLKLCQWRYHFLLPHVEVLVFFASQYKNKPSEGPWKVIANYGIECMEDFGLFLGYENTDPPKPLGCKIWEEWIKRWTQVLVNIWQDKSFEKEKQVEITQWVLMYAIPDSPKGIKPAIRRNLLPIKDKVIFMELCFGATMAEDPVKLHGLFEQTFTLLPLTEDERILELKECLIILNNVSEDIDENVNKICSLKILQAYSGDKMTVDPSLIPILDAIGLKLNEANKKLSEKDYTEEEQKDTKKLIELISKRDQFRQNISEFVPSGPIILTPISKDNKREALIPHDYIQHHSRDVRIETLKDILKSLYISEYTKQIVKKKTDAISSGDRIVWQPASGEICNALLKDFLYAHSLFKQIMCLSLDDNELFGKAWKGTLCPDLETVLNDLPIILQEPLEKTSIIRRVKGEISKLSGDDINKLSGLSEILDWYLKEIFFIPVSFPLNPWEIIKHVLSVYEKNGPRNVDILHTIKEWINVNEDPLAYLMVFEIALNIRFEAKENEKEVFCNDDFYRFLDNLLEVLLLGEKVGSSKPSNPSYVKIHAIWNMRCELAKYYLQYIDLNASNEIADEKKVAVAWWMAREAVSSITNFVTVRYPSLNDQIRWLQEKTKGEISKQTKLIMITHLYEDQRKYQSIGRYNILSDNASLAAATLSMLMPRNDKLAINNNTLDGLKEPATALNSNFRDSIIQTLGMQAVLGKGQIPREDRSELPLYWNISFCVSAPIFMHAYYKDAFDLLGKDNVGIIDDAEKMSKADFLDKELVNLQQKIKDKDGISSASILASLEVYITCHGKLPAQSFKLEKNKDLLNTICQLDPPWGELCLASFILILKRLQLSVDSQLAAEFKQFFIQIDYDKLSDTKLNYIIEELISIVLLGYEYSILNPVFERISTDKRIRKSLGDIKLSLEYTFPRVPPIHRERIKRLLADLADVNISEKPL